LIEETVELAAGGVEGTLLLLRAIMNKRAAIFVDRIPEKPVPSQLSERRVVV
jgi:hypothetical protein